MKILKKILLVLLIVFVIAQFFGPERNEGDLASREFFINETNPPDNVHIVLKESCFDCHSNRTRYPWYNRITPVNYWMADHIKHAKGDFNVSSWDAYSAKKKDHKLEEVIEKVTKKEMPLPSYTWMHSDANLTDEQIAAIVEWAENARLRYGLEQRPQ